VRSEVCKAPRLGVMVHAWRDTGQRHDDQSTGSGWPSRHSPFTSVWRRSSLWPSRWLSPWLVPGQLPQPRDSTTAPSSQLVFPVRSAGFLQPLYSYWHLSPCSFGQSTIWEIG
jgi:hypothetical protein